LKNGINNLVVLRYKLKNDVISCKVCHVNRILILGKIVFNSGKGLDGIVVDTAVVVGIEAYVGVAIVVVAIDSVCLFLTASLGLNV
jgi:hypothetical protein